MGGSVRQPIVGTNADGRLEVFAVGGDDALWQIWQKARNNGWSAWQSMGGNVRQPTVGNNQDGRLEVFAVGSDEALWHTWQVSPNGSWV
jgi:acylphosphatase